MSIYIKINIIVSVENACRRTTFVEKDLPRLMEESNAMFKFEFEKGFNGKKVRTYFCYEFNKSLNIGNMYLLSKCE